MSIRPKARSLKHKALSYVPMREAEAELSRDLAEWLAPAAPRDLSREPIRWSQRFQLQARIHRQ